MKTVSLIVLAAVGLSLQANAASESTLNGDGSSIANSLAPNVFNANAADDTSYLSVMGSSLGTGNVSGPIMDASVVVPGNANGSSIQNFSAIAASSTDFNNNPGTETIKTLPEPTTLALTTLGGLSALIFTRHFRKSRRA